MAERYIKVEDAHTLGSPYYGKDTPILEIVRCKNCKYNYHNLIPSREEDHECTKWIELPITADFYCAWGEDDGV